MCVSQPLVYDAKSLSGDFYYGKKIEQRVFEYLSKYLSGIKHSVRVVMS